MLTVNDHHKNLYRIGLASIKYTLCVETCVEGRDFNAVYFLPPSIKRYWVPLNLMGLMTNITMAYGKEK